MDNNTNLENTNNGANETPEQFWGEGIRELQESDIEIVLKGKGETLRITKTEYAELVRAQQMLEIVLRVNANSNSYDVQALIDLVAGVERKDDK